MGLSGAGLVVALALSTLNAAHSGPLLDSLYSDTLGSTANKGSGFCALGDLFFCDGDYARASMFYERAFATTQDYRHALLRSAALVAQRSDAAAERVLKDILKAAPQHYRAEAFFYLGLVQWQRNSHSQALDCFIESLEGSDSVGWYLPALTGAWYSAQAMGFTGQAERYLQRIRRVGTPLLEEKILAKKASTSYALGKTPPPQPPAPKPPKTEQATVLVSAPTQSGDSATAPARGKAAVEQFTVQVGSFSAKSNAQEVYAKLKKDFATVSIKSATVGEGTFYRVHVGSFANREAAEQFARRQIEPRKMTFKIVAR
jgi:cell division septation protein DedD